MKIQTIDDFLALFPAQPRHKAGNGWLVICPAHNDKNPSLWVTPSKNPDFIANWKCQAGCSPEAVLLAKGLTWNDMRCNSHKLSEVVRRLEYTIRNASGELIATHIRLEYDNGEKSFLWERNGVSGLGGLRVADLPLFNSEKISKYPETDLAILNEGEKPTQALEGLGVLSLGTVTGASSTPSIEALRPIAQRAGPVCLWQDNDPPGKGHMERIAARLHSLGKSCRLIHWADAPAKGDAADFVAAGGTLQELKRLASEAPEYKPKESDISLVCMAQVEPESVSWLWKPYIPKRKVTGIDGDPGVGKSHICLGIATAVTLGRGLPGQELTEPSNVVIASAEDGLGDTIRPRLDAMRADVSRIFAIDGALTLDKNGFALLETYLEKECPALLIIDPLFAYLGAGVDIYRANETRAVMAQLARLAEKFQIAILTVRHLTKGGMSKAIYRGQGSIDFTAACRSVLLAGYDAENPQNRALVHIKSNLAPAGPAIGYELREGSFYWTGESTLTAAQILAADNGAGASELDEAIAFLKDELTEGSLPAKDVYRDAERVGISKRTLDRAKAQLGVTSQKQGGKGKRGGGVWAWELPNDLDCQGCHIEEFGNLNHSEAKKEIVTEGLGNLNLEAVLGMPVEKAIEIWRSEGAPIIHLGPGENCQDLAKLLSNQNVELEHLRAVRAWLEKVLKRRGE